jgi:hypothetical protein
MRRRQFLALLGSGAVAASPVSWPLAARAQPIPVIGFLGGASAPGFAPQLDGFRKGLSEAVASSLLVRADEVIE